MFVLTDLGTLPGHSFSIARAISETGDIVGDSGPEDGKGSHGFFWRNGKMHDLGTLGGPNSAAQGLNSSGQVVGTADVEGGEDRVAFIWTANTGMQPLGLPEDNSAAFAINESGHVVGNRGEEGSGGGFVWSNNQVERDLPVIDQDEGNAPLAINKSGYVVGVSGGVEVRRARAWPPAGPLRDLKLTESSALAINDHNLIAGVWGSKGFTLSEQGAMQVLQPLQGDSASFAHAINNSGEVVGISSSGGDGRAVIWSSAGDITDLNTLIAPDPNRVVTLLDANGITNDGKITGNAQFQVTDENNNIHVFRHAYLLSPVRLDPTLTALGGLVLQILAGVYAGGPGFAIFPNGIPGPVDPGNPIFEKLPRNVQGALAGYAISELAILLNSSTARTQIRRAAIDALRADLEGILGSLRR